VHGSLVGVSLLSLWVHAVSTYLRRWNAPFHKSLISSSWLKDLDDLHLFRGGTLVLNFLPSRECASFHRPISAFGSLGGRDPFP